MNYILEESLFAENPLINTSFPFLIINELNRNSFPKRFTFQAMHWHNDIQFIIVLKGKIHIQTSKKESDVIEGNGVFINKKVLHRITSGKDSEYKSFIFPDSLILSSNEGLHHKFVTTYTHNKKIELSIIDASTATYTILYNLSNITSSSENNSFYELEVISLLHSLWGSFIQSLNIDLDKPSISDIKKQKRLSLALSFIHTHFSEDITLTDIALSCHVSKSELLRLFKTTLQVSPYEYLIDFRIKKSMDFLQSTDLLVSEITSLVGYNSQSQFGKHFKERVNLSPLQYRNSNYIL